MMASPCSEEKIHLCAALVEARYGWHGVQCSEEREGTLEKNNNNLSWPGNQEAMMVKRKRGKSYRKEAERRF